MKKNFITILLEEIATKYRFITFVTIISTVFAIILSLVWPHTFESAGFFGPILGVESPYSALVKNINLRLRNVLYGSGLVVADVYAKILRSRRIETEVIERCGLMHIYKTDYIEDAIKRFEMDTNIQVGWEGLISVSAKAHDPEISAQIVNEWMKSLDRFLREAQMARGLKERIFINERLRHVEVRLQIYKDSLNKFLTRHGLIEQSSDTLPDVYSLNNQISGALRVYNQLNTDLIKQEALFSYYSAMGENLPMTKSLRTKIRMMKNNLQKFSLGKKGGLGPGFSEPLFVTSQLQSQYRNLRRKVSMYSDLYNLLVALQEIASLDEKKDVPAIEIIDWAEPPQRRVWPQRAIIVLAAAASSFILSLLICLSERHEEFL
ncbi:MAG TPA: hypothetical protein EYP58_01390 [bacterium (Candidatus Stahlbacteria)]|nr:hypothetical protein [Candidatus Stahlbacteria bacterium]